MDIVKKKDLLQNIPKNTSQRILLKGRSTSQKYRKIQVNGSMKKNDLHQKIAEK